MRNNIFAFGHTAQVQASRNESRLRFKYERNIVVWEPEVPLLDGGDWNWKLNEPPGRGEPKDTAIFRNNLYWPTDGKKPALLTKAHYTWDEWRKMGRDSGTLFADPMFEDIAKRDFRLKPGSPAEKIGFKPWDLTLAGVRKADAAWVELAAKGGVYPNWDTDARPWPSPAYKVDQSFETAPLGVIGIRNAKYQRPNERKDMGEGFGVSEEAASPIPFEGSGPSKRSLKAQDMPGLAHSYDPVLDIFPKWEGGTFNVSFDIMAQPGAEWFFEMRVKGGEYGAGPYVKYQNGKLTPTLGKGPVPFDVAPNQWVRVSITATTETPATATTPAKQGSWMVSFTREDGEKKSYLTFAAKPGWNAASYLLFSSLADKKTAYFIDNVKLEQVK